MDTDTTAHPTADAGADPSQDDVVATDPDGNPLLLDVPAELEPEHAPLIDAHGRVRLSYSRIESYRTCPRKFRFQYIDRLPQQPSVHASFGTSVHSALEEFYDRSHPQEPTEDELVAFLYDVWDSSGFVGVDREEQKRWYLKGQDTLRRYHRRVTGRYRLPVATEAWFEMPMGDDALVVGFIDRVDTDDDGSLRVVDYKTGRFKDRDTVKHSLQLALYALACEHLYGDLPVSVALDFVVAGREVVAGIDELDLDAARAAVAETAAAVKRAAYEPTPMRLCDWCDFRSVCPAWEPDGDGETLGAAELELQQLRRTVRRDVARLRALEAGVQRIRGELADGAAPPAGAPGG